MMISVNDYNVVSFSLMRSYLKKIVEEVRDGTSTTQDFFDSVSTSLEEPGSPFTWDDAILVKRVENHSSANHT